MNAELRVALDVGSKKHCVAIGSSDGRVLDEFEITHEKEGFARFFERVGAFEKQDGLAVVVAAMMTAVARPIQYTTESRRY